jgi:hypothetical protein
MARAYWKVSSKHIVSTPEKTSKNNQETLGMKSVENDGFKPSSGNSRNGEKC